jgi:hypothetical protein
MISRKGAFVAGAIAAMVIGSGSAYAANGGTLILGHKNSATKLTTLKNSKGTALKLTSRRGTAPLAVNSGAKVANLNSDKVDGVSGEQLLRTTGKAADADRVDGLSSEQFLRTTGKAADAESVDGVDSTALALASGATAFVVANGVFVDADGDGIIDSLVAIAVCPAGTKLTGGGEDNITSGFTFMNRPSGGNGWIVASTADPAVDLVTDLRASAVCYNPRGAVPGGTDTSLPPAPAAAQRTTAAEIAPEVATRLARGVRKQP